MTTRFSKTLTAVIFLTFVLGAVMPARALECSFCNGKSPKELIKLSVSMKSGALRAQIRGWLAENHPDTAAGLTAQAWVKASNGASTDEVVALNRQAIAKDPSIVTPYINAGFAYDRANRYQEALELYREAIEFGLNDPILVQNTYFTFKNGLKDLEAAERSLDEAERKGYTTRWGIDYVRGLTLQSRDRQRAVDYFKSSLEKGGDEIVLNSWINHKLRVLSARRADQNERYDVLRYAVSWAERNNSARALYLVAEKLEKEFKSYSSALDYYEQSYNMMPTPDAATAGFAAGGNYEFERAVGLLERAARDFPDNYSVLNALTWAYTSFKLEPENALRYGKLSLDASPRHVDLLAGLDNYTGALEIIGDWDSTVSLYEKYLPQMSGRNYNNALGSYINNRIMAGEYAHAARLMETAEKQSGMSQSWLAVRKNRIAAGLRLAGERDRYFAENPFLQDWEEQFGESLRVSVEFETGKADIRPQSFPVLDRAARALKTAAAENYVFLIEGHTDSRGSDEVNMPLSQERAASVERYFIENAEILDDRIQTAGYGPRNPVATNETDSGRQRNRRVEIRPFGNISAPQIATNGWLHGSAVRLSSDGRTAVTGHTPIQVWDLERMVRLHELPMGGNIREISPNGRYLAVRSAFEDATGTTTHAIYIYDLRTGVVRNQIQAVEFVNNLLWSPFSNEIVWTDRRGYLQVFNLPENKLRGVRKIDTVRGSQRLLWLNDGARILVQASSKHPMQVVDAKTLETITSFHPGGWVHALSQTHDASRVVATTNDYELVVWDSRTWQETLRKRLPTSGFYMKGHPSKPWVMIADGFGNDRSQTLVDITDGRILSSTQAFTEEKGTFTPDGSFYAVGDGYSISYLDLETMEVKRRFTGQSTNGRDLTLVPSANAVISRDVDGNSVWSLKTGRRLHRLRHAVNFPWKSAKDREGVFFSVDFEGRVVTFDTQTFTDEIVLETGMEIQAMDVSKDFVVLASVPDYQRSYKDPKSQIVVLDRVSLQEIGRFTTDIVTEPVSYPDIYDPKVMIRIADNGLIAFTSSWTSGYRKGVTHGRIVTVFDAYSGEQTLSFQAEGGNSDMAWKEGGGELWFKDKARWYVHDPKTGSVLRRETPKAEFEVKLADGNKVYWFWDHVRQGGNEVTFPNNLMDFEVNEALNLGVGITTGNEIVFVDLRNMVRALTIAPKKNGEWIAYAPDGGYSSSLGGTEGVFWSLGDNYLPFDALRNQFEQPGLIRKRLQAIASGNPLPENDNDVAPDVFEAPYKVTLLSPRLTSTEDDTFLLELNVEKDSVSVPDPEVEYILNGRKVLKSRGFDEEAVFEGGETIGITRRFDLLPGRNVIEASLVWRDAKIMSQRVEVTRSSAADAEEAVSGQSLWFFGVGVSDYEISSQNLNFAHRDATELARLLKEQEGRLFNKVNTLTLTNEEATERNVRIQMNEFLSAAAPDDVVVVFIAGHGVTDEEQQLYYITHEADMTRPYTGMAVDRFRQFLENRPINQRALFLLDICHSGAAEGRVVADDAVQNLTTGTGAVVFASSSGSQKSYEDEAFGGGHGAFTAAILDGLKGPADNSVGNRDGLNSLQEMIVFTTSEVPKLTQGRQRPTIPGIDNSVDYALTRAK